MHSESSIVFSRLIKEKRLLMSSNPLSYDSFCNDLAPGQLPANNLG